jgi:hypothetical protein
MTLVPEIQVRVYLYSGGKRCHPHCIFFTKGYISYVLFVLDLFFIVIDYPNIFLIYFFHYFFIYIYKKKRF